MLATLLCLLAATSSTAHRGDRARTRPKLVQASYEESNDGSSPRRQLSAFEKRADSVTFSIRLGGERIRGGSRYDESVTDTDLHGEASHPWVLGRAGAGQRILRRIHRSLRKRGHVNVRVRAANGSGARARKVTIVLSDCAEDPPLYPLSCEVGG